MRALRIDRDFTIHEIDSDPKEWMSGHQWDAERIAEGHDAWVHDEGLFEPGVVVVDIGDARRLPLPAYVTGYTGERISAATMTVEELKAILA